MKCAFGCGAEAVEGSRLCQACKELAFAVQHANHVNFYNLAGRVFLRGGR